MLLEYYDWDVNVFYNNYIIQYQNEMDEEQEKLHNYYDLHANSDKESEKIQK